MIGCGHLVLQSVGLQRGERSELIEQGKVIPVIDHVYPLSEASRAVSHVGEGHARGKVVITI